MKKWFYILNVAMFILISIGNAFYITQNAIWQKSLTSAGFVILGIINLIYAIKSKNANNKFCISMVIGLFFAMLGDILLEINFIVGALFFAIGHIIYFVSYCLLHKINKLDFIFGSIISVISTLIIVIIPIFNFNSILLEIIVTIYAIIILFMVGKATTNLIKKRNLINIVIFAGSILFFFSDLMLLLGNFGGMNMGNLCLATYYPAECLLAMSLLFTKEKE